MRPRLVNLGYRSVTRGRVASVRAVSPIIATILLVAITVVLAALLYILVSGFLAHGSGLAPLSTALGFGAAVQESSSSLTSNWCGAGHQCWKMPIAYTADGLTAAQISVTVSTSGGSGLVGASVYIVGLNGTGWIQSPNPAASWTTGGDGSLTPSTALSASMEVWVDSGKSTGAFGASDTLTAYGVSSFSGQVGPVNLP